MLYSDSTSLSLRRFAICLLASFAITGTALSQDFSKANGEAPPPSPLIQRANDALAAGNYSGAAEILTKLNRETPNNPQVLYDLGLTLEALASEPAGQASQQPAEAALTPEECYRKAIDANAAFAPAHVALGLLLARTNRTSDAREQLTTAVSLPDTEPGVKARALRALAKLDASSAPATASSELLDALKITPEQPSDVLLSAEIAESSQDLPAAEQAYRRYLATPSGRSDTQATAALAHVLLAERHPAEAETLLTQALAVHPGDPSFTAQLADAYITSGDPSKAAKAAPLLEKLHTAHPDDNNITRLLARVYLQTGQPEEAEKLYASLPGSGKDPTLLTDRAEALMRLKRPAEAEKLLKQALADPHALPGPAELGRAALDLAFAASATDDPRTTLHALALRATVQPPSPPSLFLEATANDALHQSRQAVELYKKFLAAAAGNFPEQESQARHRISELERR